MARAGLDLMADIARDLAAVRQLIGDARALALLCLRSPRYETGAEFRAAVDAVLRYYGLLGSQEKTDGQ